MFAACWFSEKYTFQLEYTGAGSGELTAACCIFQVNFANGIAPLAKLDVLQFPLVYAYVLPRMAAL
jgi:hypothetical protein